MATEKIVLDVEGMSCGHCENRVKRAVGALKGVKNVSVDLQGKNVTVDYIPGKVNLNAIKEAIVEQGYEVITR